MQRPAFHEEGSAERAAVSPIATGHESLEMMSRGQLMVHGGASEVSVVATQAHQLRGMVHRTGGERDLNDFSASGVTGLDLLVINSDLSGFRNGFTDGRYGYFVPYFNSSGEFGKLVRVDLRHFSRTSVRVLDLEDIHPHFVGFLDGFTDGRFGYLVPYGLGASRYGRIARFQLFNGTTGP